jgi:hypothetical protein
MHDDDIARPLERARRRGDLAAFGRSLPAP